MKLRNIAISALVAATAMLTSCVEKIDWDAMDATMEITPAQASFEIEGGEQTVHLYTTRSWKAKDVPEWVVLTPSEGEPVKDGIDITIKVAKNDGYNRTGAIEISGGIISEILTISQAGPDGENDGKISVADFISKADTKTEYVLTGIITNVTNSSFKGFNLTDETGTISIAFPTNFDDYASQLEDGGTVSVKGVYEFYAEKNLHEMSNGSILSYVAPQPIDPSTIKQVTVKEFIEKADPITNFRLVGKVENFNSNYKSFDLNDGTGTVYVYSLSDASKSEFGSKIANGGTVTLYGKYYLYNGKVEITKAVVEKYEAGETPVVPSTDLFYAPLTSTMNDFTIEDKTGTGIWTLSDKGYGMIGTGFINSTDTDSESWLISPVIDLTKATTAFLEFDHATNFFKDVATAAQQCTVLLKAEGGEWTKIDPLFPTTLSWGFVNTGSIDISSYAGKKIQIAFKYTSTTEKAGTWEVKNVRITPEKQAEITDGITWKIGAASQSWSAETDGTYKSGYAATVNGIKVGYYQNTSSSAPVAAKDDHIRVYKNYALRISSDKALKTIIFYCTGGDYCNDMTIVSGDGSVVKDSNKLTLTWTGNAKEMLFTCSGGQNRFSKIVFVTE